MYRKTILLALAFFLFPLINHAQNGLGRGFYCSFEAEGGAVGGGPTGPGAVFEYGLRSVLGYRFSAPFTLAGGAVGASTLSLGGKRVTTVPLFVRLRSDFLDRPLSPFAELDLGYNFMLPNGDCSKVAAPLVDNSRREPFGNGSREYLPLAGNLDWFGLEGEFVKLTLGMSWKVRDHRMSAGVAAGAGRGFHGTFVRGAEAAGNKSARYSRLDYLEEAVPGEDGSVAGYRRGDPVLTAGRPNRVSPSLSLRLSFSL